MCTFLQMRTDFDKAEHETELAKKAALDAERLADEACKAASQATSVQKTVSESVNHGMSLGQDDSGVSSGTLVVCSL